MTTIVKKVSKRFQILKAIHSSILPFIKCLGHLDHPSVFKHHPAVCGLSWRTPPISFTVCAETSIKQSGRLRAISALFCFPLLAALLTACDPNDSQYEHALLWKLKLFQRLESNLSKPLEGRLQQMPSDFLKATQNDEKSIGIYNAILYAARTPTADEIALFKTYVGLLPPALQKVFTKKLLAVYLIDDFAGGGLANWVVDRDGHTYYYIILNSSLFTESLDDWLTYKNDSQFDQSTLSPTIRIQTQTDYKALLYGLLHEGTHIADIEHGITPYFDPHHRRLTGRNEVISSFTNRVWRQWLQPDSQYDFSHRNDLNPYGSFPKKGHIPRSELPAMFLQLTKTPFVSFYSGKSWIEDLAEYVAFNHIEKKLGGAITVELLYSGVVVDSYAPIKMSLVKQREKYLQSFYN